MIQRQATVDSYTFGKSRRPPGSGARWSPQNTFRTSRRYRLKDLSGGRDCHDEQRSVEEIEQETHTHTEETCSAQYNVFFLCTPIIPLVNYIVPKGLKRTYEIVWKEGALCYIAYTCHISPYTVDFLQLLCYIGLSYWKCLSKCDRFLRGGSPPSRVAGTMDQWWRVQWKATGPATTQRSAFLETFGYQKR